MKVYVATFPCVVYVCMYVPQYNVSYLTMALHVNVHGTIRQTYHSYTDVIYTVYRITDIDKKKTPAAVSRHRR